MAPRAHLLLARDLQELQRNNCKGITAFPVSEDMMKWEADIQGLQDTVWHGLLFHLTINFTPEYNFVPPVVTFRTIPFHPNVDQHTGRPCIDILDNPGMWNTCYTLSSILLTLQVMLSNPVLKSPVNLEAAQMLIKDESMYRQTVLRLFQTSLQLKDDSSESSKEPDKLIRYRSIKVSFDDYYKTWSEIATSKASEHYRAPLLENPNFIKEYYKQKKMKLRQPKEWYLRYAASMVQHDRENKRPHKASYQTESPQLFPTPNSETETDTVTKTDETEEGWKSDYENTNESWEEEVEDLVAWTSTLDTDTLEG